MAEKAEKKSGGFVEGVKTVVYALLIAGVFRTLFFQPFWIPSGSMKETLLIGDFLFVNKMAYGYSYASCPSIIIPRFGVNIDAEDLCGWADGDNSRLLGGDPERGDVVVFRHPVSGRDYIKRLIGLPGDTVRMVDGQIILNGEPVPQENDGEYREIKAYQGSQGQTPQCENRPVGLGGVCTKTRKTETLPNGKSYAVLNIANAPADNTPLFTVPEGEYFLHGAATGT